MTKRLWMIALVFFCSPLLFTQASDHLDAPSLSGNGQVDLNDLYAFQAPGASGNSVLILTVNPFAGSMSPTNFATDVSYDFNVDINGDAVADVTYRANFSGAGQNQTYTVTRNGASFINGSTGINATNGSGATALAGNFDDPFFFDLAGFNNGFNFTGTDAFAGANVSAIVLELPSADFGATNVGVWAATSRNGVQVDRVGRPAINTALISSGLKEAFNLGTPNNDLATFGDDVRANITALSNVNNANALTPVLLPDILTFDTSNPAGFLNGRGLSDDVIDAELNLLSAGAVTGDLVNGNDVPFRSVFPYLAVAAIPEPSSALLGGLALFGILGSRRRK